MKKSLGIKTLKLEKITIAPLGNPQVIRGGEGDILPILSEDYCPESSTTDPKTTRTLIGCSEPD